MLVWGQPPTAVQPGLPRLWPPLTLGWRGALWLRPVPEQRLHFLLPWRAHHERLHHDPVGVHADGNHGQQGIFRRLQLPWLALLDDGYVPGLRVEHEQIILVLRE